MEISKKKRIVIISSIVVAIIIIVASIFLVFFHNNDSKVASNEPVEEIRKIPDVSLENTIFEMSETELTNEKIKITISSQLENYNLYYYIKPEEENENIEENYILYQNEIEIEENANLYFKYELEGNYSENPYILEINNIDKEMKEEIPENEGATEEQLQKEKVTKISNTAPYYIVVNYVANVVTIYGKDENNEYTRPVKAMICSTGVATPRSGIYKLGARSRWRALFGNVYGQYTVNIEGNILFHSVPYLSTDNSTLEYWEYDKLGTSASAGCIRLKVEDAIWIYNNCGRGTQVEFSSNAPTPLGKPGAKKISGYPELRGFDPTDPAANNPWKNANLSQNNNNNNNSNNDNSQAQKPEPPKKEEIEEPKQPEEKPIVPEEPDEKDEEDDKNPPTEEEKKDTTTNATDD